MGVADISLICQADTVVVWPRGSLGRARLCTQWTRRRGRAAAGAGVARRGARPVTHNRIDRCGARAAAPLLGRRRVGLAGGWSAWRGAASNVAPLGCRVRTATLGRSRVPTRHTARPDTDTTNAKKNHPTNSQI